MNYDIPEFCKTGQHCVAFDEQFIEAVCRIAKEALKIRCGVDEWAIGTTAGMVTGSDEQFYIVNSCGEPPANNPVGGNGDHWHGPFCSVAEAIGGVAALIPCTPANQPPVPVITGLADGESGETGTANGGSSVDPDNDALIYIWSEVTNTGITLDTPNAVNTGYTLPAVTQDTPATIQLCVNDGNYPDVCTTQDIVIRAVDCIAVEPIQYIDSADSYTGNITWPLLATRITARQDGLFPGNRWVEFDGLVDDPAGTVVTARFQTNDSESVGDWIVAPVYTGGWIGTSWFNAPTLYHGSQLTADKIGRVDITYSQPIIGQMQISTYSIWSPGKASFATPHDSAIYSGNIPLSTPGITGQNREVIWTWDNFNDTALRFTYGPGIEAGSNKIGIRPTTNQPITIAATKTGTKCTKPDGSVEYRDENGNPIDASLVV